MNLKLSTLLLLVFSIVCCSAQDVSQKSSSKVSAAKAKLAKTELGAKPALSAALLQKGDNADDEHISLTDLGLSAPDGDINDTVTTDHHTYYNSTFYTNPVDAKKFWINLDESPEKQVVQHDKLSDSYRQATTIELSFDFPFYGNPLKNVTIATGGFLYMGDYLHNWIAATQYVAPLMANFDTSVSHNSVIKYADNGTAFTVLWENVYIQNRQTDGSFSFQVTLLKSGDIIFAYRDVPYQISNISDAQHPVKVGLSDAYILERQIFFVRRKTVYEYSRIHNDTKWNVVSNSALYFTALPTCISLQDCSSCLSSGAKLNCSWCDTVQRCSDGIDRQRQNWISKGCTVNKAVTCPAVKVATTAPPPPPPPLPTRPTTTTPPPTAAVAYKTETSIFSTKGTDMSKVVPGKSSTSKSATSMYIVDQSLNSSEVIPGGNEEAAHLMHGEEGGSSESGVSSGAIATIMVFLVALVAVSVWIFYAYKNPHSSSGQFLIKYRPSQWAVKKGSESNLTTTNSRHF